MRSLIFIVVAFCASGCFAQETTEGPLLDAIVKRFEARTDALQAKLDEADQSINAAKMERVSLIDSLRLAANERRQAREERQGLLDKITEYRKQNGTLASRFFWLCVSVGLGILFLAGCLLKVYSKIPKTLI